MAELSRRSNRATHCDVCERRLCGRGPAVTGVCLICRQAGAEFARNWAADLIAGGATIAAAATVLGTTYDSVRVRMSERRAAAA